MKLERMTPTHVVQCKQLCRCVVQYGTILSVVSMIQSSVMVQSSLWWYCPLYDQMLLSSLWSDGTVLDVMVHSSL